MGILPDRLLFPGSCYVVLAGYTNESPPRLLWNVALLLPSPIQRPAYSNRTCVLLTMSVESV